VGGRDATIEPAPDYYETFRIPPLTRVNKGLVISFLKRTFKCGLCSKLYTMEAIADDADMD